MTDFLQLLVLGMATGGFYTINALGVVVVFRSSGVINFASGGTAMVGGYLEWQLHDEWGWPSPLAVLGAVVGSALVGLMVYLIVIRPLSAAATLTKVIGTLAVLVSLQQAIVLIFGGVSKVPTSVLPDGSAHIGPVRVGEDSLSLLAIATALTFGLWAAYRLTRFGLATSALAESPRSLAALGWNVYRLRAANWAVGGALAGLAGAGLGPILQLTPGTFTNLLIPTLAGAMIGGLKSFPMTLVGGLLVGGAQAEAARYVTWTGAGDAVPFLLIILVLVVRGRSLPLRSFVHERLPRVGNGEVKPARVAVFAIVVATLALLVKADWVIGATTTVVIAIVLLSQVVITGYAGQLSLAQLTIGGVGAIAAANAEASWHTGFLLSLVIGMVAVVPVSLLVGLPSLRARGVSLAIATLGLAVAIDSVVLNNNKLTGGLAGLTIDPQSLFGWSIDATDHPRRYFFVSFIVFGLLAFAVTNLRRGRSGRRLLAVRNNERAAQALGINVVGAKLYAFTVAGMLAAAGGILIVFRESLPEFTDYSPLAGLSNLIGAVLGGIGYVPGALFGGLLNQDGLPNALLYPVVGNLTWWTEFFPLITGLALVLQLAVDPDGVAAAGSRRRDAAARRKAAAARTVAARPGTATSGPAPSEPSAADSVDARPAASGKASAALRLARATRRPQVNSAYQLDSSAAGGELTSRGRPLTARNLRVVFGSVVALDAVDVDVRPGEVLAVIGPNGAGKTTLLDALTGFVPAEGAVELDGQRIDTLPAHRRARAGIARSFQSLELFEDMTVLDNVRCASDPQDLRSLLLDIVRPGRSTITPATRAAIDTLGLRGRLDSLPTELGYGDRRLVAIARALAGSPAVLLLDEPAAGLSEFERIEVARMITKTAREWQISIILIEHDVNLVRQVSDRVIALDFGRVLASGPAAEVLAHPDVVRAYLGAEDPGARDVSAAPVASGRPSASAGRDSERAERAAAAGEGRVVSLGGLRDIRETNSPIHRNGTRKA